MKSVDEEGEETKEVVLLLLTVMVVIAIPCSKIQCVVLVVYSSKPIT